MIAQLPSIPSLRELQCLLSEDLEADVFHNIVHLQVHRRIRAIARFRALCEQGNFHQVRSFLRPLSVCLLLAL